MFEIPPFAFVVDTEQYAGNFERQLCAYSTGIVGECTIGSEEASQFAEENPGPNPFEEKILQPPDEHGCRRPVEIWSTPGWFNNGMGGHFRLGENGTEAQEHYKEECLAQSRKKSYAAEESNQQHKQEWEEKAQRPFTEHPAFQSVAIFFGEEPTADMIEILKKRSRAFCRRENITVIGFRLLSLSIKESGRRIE